MAARDAARGGVVARDAGATRGQQGGKACVGAEQEKRKEENGREEGAHKREREEAVRRWRPVGGKGRREIRI
jgi:hypothetical protein